ncbi:hypothetical protein PCIT_a3287 [Pseudoalteromonas citrea]|uniref:Chitin-binding type-3 domain-containing protein n=2 Tax=Pseudoalteromonas citrea TaxID=43655 RepID=A0AAD4AGN9_9GAMM|nr:peptide-N-glycosidase F-related protein [Pseudoalteromonas citrea]KAF7768790.1 hypothetical protein PCIT_a3287 [Pseudoalteromonas citrea]
MTLIKYALIYSILAMCSSKVFALHADSQTELISYQSFTQHGDHSYAVALPSDANLEQQQFLEVELGCAAQGCSDWDYTVRFEWLKEGERYELGRLITPYAGYMQRGMHGFDRTWTRKYLFDISHLAPVLKGEGVLNAHYGGWGAKKSAFGFSAKLLARGAVTRKVHRVIPVYYSQPAGWPYKTAGEFAHYLPEKSLTFTADEIEAELNVIVSAHGHALSYDNPAQQPQLCGEWCERYFDVIYNANLVERTALWRTDCDQSTTFPQGGTYIYARANWCPGEIVEPFIYSLDTQQSQSTLDIDWQNFSWQPSQYGSDAPRYIVSAVLTTYEAITVDTDLAVEQILTPNSAIDSRLNQSCADVRVAVRNQGQTVINHIEFTYGVTQQHQFTWQGALHPNERQVVQLPARFWGIFSPENANMMVRATTAQDEIDSNNLVYSRIEAPLSISDSAQLYLLSGKFADETSVTIKNSKGEALKQWSQFNASAEHRLDLDIPVGCYTLEVNDSEKDGLAFPFLNQRKGKGSIAIHDIDDIHQLPADFGRQLRLPFTVGYRLGGCAASPWQSEHAYAQVGERVSFQGIIYQVKHWSYNFQPDEAGPYDAWHALSYCDGSTLSY